MDYQRYSSHRLMIRDAPRTEAYRAAIAKIVKPGDVVLDVGAGTGVLSLFAAQAGAARVYAVERTATAGLATHLARLNGFEGVIKVIRGDVRQAQLPEKVDVIVSEWMGTIGVDENLLGAVLWTRDHFLKDGGSLIPNQVTALVAPATTTQRVDAGFFHNRPYDLDLSPLAESSVHELLMDRRRVSPADLAASPKKLWVSKIATDPPETVRTPYEADLSFSIRKAAKLSTLAAWFSAELAPGCTLTNAPDAPDTHWGQLLLPLAGETSVKSGDKVGVRVTARLVGPGPLQFDWSVRVNDGEWSGYDTMAGSVAAPPAVERSALSRFMADLAIDPDLLAEFLSDPDGVMGKYELPEDQRAAVKSQDLGRIQEALYEPSRPLP